MTDLAEELKRLGLSEYLDVLVAEGFDTWETMSDIAESDLNSLNVKIGHRRKLQRAIAESRGPVYNHHPPITRTKRKYARHPKVRVARHAIFTSFLTIRQITGVLLTLPSQTSMHPGDLYLPM